MELTKEYFDEQLKNLATKTDVKAIDKRVDNLKSFVLKNLVTNEELEEILKSELPTKAYFARLQTWVDGIAKNFRNENGERAANFALTSQTRVQNMRLFRSSTG